MHPKIFEIPLVEHPLLCTWPVFIGLVIALLVLVQVAAKVGEKSKLKGQLLSILPTAAFVTAFVTFVQTPFGRLPINSYGFCIMVGFLLASWIAVKRGRELGISSDFVLDVGIIAMIFGIVGAKINYLAQYTKDTKEIAELAFWSDMGFHPLGAILLGPIPLGFWFYRMKTSGQKVRIGSWQTGVLLLLTVIFAFAGARAYYVWQHQEEFPFSVFKRWQSGFVLYGGLAAGIGAGLLYTKMRGMSIARIADLTAAPMMLALAFGRIGCFMNGCCHGKKGEGFPCVSFPAGSPATEPGAAPGGPDGRSLPVHPTQIYEAIAAVAFFFILSRIYRKKRKAEGEVFLIMIMLYGAWRFAIEWLRGDDRPKWGGLFYSQWVSLAAFIVSAAWLFLLRKRAQSAPPQPEAKPASPAA